MLKLEKGLWVQYRSLLGHMFIHCLLKFITFIVNFSQRNPTVDPITGIIVENRLRIIAFLLHFYFVENVEGLNSVLAYPNPVLKIGFAPVLFSL